MHKTRYDENDASHGTTIRIGTRGSPLALAQTEAVRAGLIGHHPELASGGADRGGTENGGGTEVVVIKTTGDAVLDRPLAEIGGKGLFTKEIDDALLEGRIDMAVHSVKDLPTRLPDGIDFVCTLPREDPRDVLLAHGGAGCIAAVPAGSVVGTASLRRQAQVLYHRPDLTVVPLRGNVQTRLTKLARGTINATLLALAGLRRLAMTDVDFVAVDPEEMLPAVGQGAIGITCRSGDERIISLLADIDDITTTRCVAAERAMLDVLDGSCRTPIAGLAEIDRSGERIRLRGLIARPDGSRLIETAQEGLAVDAPRLGRAVGEHLLRTAGPGFLPSAG